MSSPRKLFSFKGSDIISLSQFTPQAIKKLFNVTDKMKKIAMNARASDLLKGNIITLLFYEPSSRTFASFAAAAKQLGGQTVEILNPQEFSSVAKGETLEDSIRVFEAYGDCIVIRHPVIGTAAKAADSAEHVPIVNAGDGAGEHPTQALLDLYTIYEKFGRLNGLTGLMAGDPLNSRTIHSLIDGLSLYKNNVLYLLSPRELELTKDKLQKYGKKIELRIINSEQDIPKNCNFWYWTRVQKERFRNLNDYKRVNNKYILTHDLLKKYGNPKLILMHPLPRVGEIETEVDQDPRALYLRTQVRNGMYIRMALLALILGKIK